MCRGKCREERIDQSICTFHSQYRKFQIVPMAWMEELIYYTKSDCAVVCKYIDSHLYVEFFIIGFT